MISVGPLKITACSSVTYYWLQLLSCFIMALKLYEKDFYSSYLHEKINTNIGNTDVFLLSPLRYFLFSTTLFWY